MFRLKECMRRKENPGYICKNDIMYKRIEGRLKIILLNHMLKEITWEYHENLLHIGAYRCYLVPKGVYFW